MSNKPDKKEELQHKIMQFQLLQQNLQSLDQRRRIVEEHIDEFYRTRLAIKDLESTKINSALIPIGAGAFVSGTLSDSDTVVISIGGGVAIRKKRKEAEEFIEERLKEIEAVLTEVSKQWQSVYSQLVLLESEIGKLQGE